MLFLAMIYYINTTLFHEEKQEKHKPLREFTILNQHIHFLWGRVVKVILTIKEKLGYSIYFKPKYSGITIHTWR